MLNPDQEQELNDKASAAVVQAVQEAFAEFEKDTDGSPTQMVLSALTVVETVDQRGNSRLSVFISDRRLITNLGLTNYASMWIGSKVGGA